MNDARSRATALYDKHAESLARARRACRERGHFSLFPETPERHPGGDAARDAAARSFATLLQRPFELEQPGTVDRVGAEVSPYTCEPLGIDYPRA
ncbi:MAG TPA: hypothetical protein VFP48_02610, partial [Steroidobacteraceae bacterium]|nr:hypothetical protein [Steroidobacteraceae bacterium]